MRKIGVLKNRANGCPQPGLAIKGSDALHILAGAGIDEDVVALVDEKRHTNLSTCLLYTSRCV